MKRAPAALLVSQDRNACRQFADLRQVLCRARVHDILTTPGEIGSGFNSGFQALNLAIQFGARDIVLVGYDATLQHGHHWHGRHGEGLNNPSQAGVEVWRGHLERQGPVLRQLGIVVRNASPLSAVAAFPRMTFEEAMR